MISTILIFLSVETSLDKEKNRSHTHTSNHLSLTNKSTFKTSNKKNWISFRFVCSQCVCLLQRHSVSSLQRLLNLLQWNSIIDESVTSISMSSLQRLVSLLKRHQKRMRCFVRFFTSLQSIHSDEDETITSQQRYESNDMKSWRTRVNINLSHSQFSSFSSQISVCSSSMRRIFNICS